MNPASFAAAADSWLGTIITSTEWPPPPPPPPPPPYECFLDLPPPPPASSPTFNATLNSSSASTNADHSSASYPFLRQPPPLNPFQISPPVHPSSADILSFLHFPSPLVDPLPSLDRYLAPSRSSSADSFAGLPILPPLPAVDELSDTTAELWEEHAHNNVNLQQQLLHQGSPSSQYSAAATDDAIAMMIGGGALMPVDVLNYSADSSAPPASAPAMSNLHACSDANPNPAVMVTASDGVRQQYSSSSCCSRYRNAYAAAAPPLASDDYCRMAATANSSEYWGAVEGVSRKQRPRSVYGGSGNALLEASISPGASLLSSTEVISAAATERSICEEEESGGAAANSKNPKKKKAQMEAATGSWRWRQGNASNSAAGSGEGGGESAVMSRCSSLTLSFDSGSILRRSKREKSASDGMISMEAIGAALLSEGDVDPMDSFHVVSCAPAKRPKMDADMSARHCLAERKRRERLNRSLDDLRALVAPSLAASLKSDKASIIEAAVQILKEKLREGRGGRGAAAAEEEEEEGESGGAAGAVGNSNSRVKGGGCSNYWRRETLPEVFREEVEEGMPEGAVEWVEVRAVAAAAPPPEEEAEAEAEEEERYIVSLRGVHRRGILCEIIRALSQLSLRILYANASYSDAASFSAKIEVVDENCNRRVNLQKAIYDTMRQCIIPSWQLESEPKSNQL